MDTLIPVPAAAVTDPRWLADQLNAAGRWYRVADRELLGVLWWYSASSVLLGAYVPELVRTGTAIDPALTGCTLYLHADGRVLDARSTGAVLGTGAAALGAPLADVLRTAIDAVAAASGAADRTLWAIATDSLGNQVLWSAGAPRLATELAEAIGPELPAPRFADAAGRTVVRRASCCLIYLTPGNAKCTSCPRQHPEDRSRRLDGLG